MPLSVEEFAHEFFQEIQSSADAHENFYEAVFFENFCEYLTECGELDTADHAFYFREGPPRIRVDGYGGDPEDTAGVLTLVVSDFRQDFGVATLNRVEMESLIAQPFRFVREALKPHWRNQLEETGEGFRLAEFIAGRWDNIKKVRIVMITNRELRVRVDGIESDEIDDRPVTYSVWDITRLHRFVVGKGKEEIAIHLESEYGTTLPLLEAHLSADEYESYLAVVPGELLAKIYDRWGARLLEQNVRVFLQARGNVNKGIQNTLKQDAAMFFAYNNGITATAEEITSRTQNGQLVLIDLKNLQIVNGGQTTASIHVAYRNKIDLSKVFVQMKLSIIDSGKSNDVVPKISEYANSQNRVNAADFFANHPFHIRMEKFSRRSYVPSPDGTFRQTKWFYERARGQYADARSLLTTAQRRKFDIEHPRPQLFSKTDLAKFLNVWASTPDKVSLGAQKNFAYFARETGNAWKKNESDFNEDYYREAIAKAIIFRSTEKIVSKQPWYEGGYRANIVAYAISRLAHEVMSLKKSVNFKAIWKQQSISKAMEAALADTAEAVCEILTNPPSGISNVTEWAKKQACWARTQNRPIRLPEYFVAELITLEEKNDEQRVARKEQKILNGIEAQTAVFERGAEYWKHLYTWATNHELLTEAEEGILKVASQIPNKIPNEKQSERLLKILAKAEEEGFQLQ